MARFRQLGIQELYKQRRSYNCLYQSDSGNLLKITLPDRDIYSYETIVLEFTVLYRENYLPELPDWTILDDSMSIIHTEENIRLDSSENLITKTITLTLVIVSSGTLLPT